MDNHVNAERGAVCSVTGQEGPGVLHRPQLLSGCLCQARQPLLQTFAFHHDSARITSPSSNEGIPEDIGDLSRPSGREVC